MTRMKWEEVTKNPHRLKATAGPLDLWLAENENGYYFAVYIGMDSIDTLLVFIETLDPEQAKEKAENILMSFIHDVVTGIGGEC